MPDRFRYASIKSIVCSACSFAKQTRVAYLAKLTRYAIQRCGSSCIPSTYLPEPWILGRIRATGSSREQLIVVNRNTTAITAIIAIISEFQHVNGYCDWSGRFDPDFARVSLKAWSLFHNDNNVGARRSHILIITPFWLMTTR